MTNPNEDLILAARGLCKQRNNRAHWNAIDRGEWDGFLNMQRAIDELLKQPPKCDDGV